VSQFLLDYGLFLAKTLTVVAAVVIIIVVAAAASRRGRDAGGLIVKNLNDRFRELGDALRKELLSKHEYKARAKEEKVARKAREKAGADAARKRLFVIDFHGDIKATGVVGLREEVTAVIAVARPGDEVLLRLENYGGLVHEHGLAAAQLVRLRDRDIRLTVAVDKVAASGGYMMACIANRLIASPFAVIGSIGVLAQIPNFRRLLDQHGVEVEQIKAGRYKRTVTMFGENTDEDRAKLTEELEDVHVLFRDLITRYRPELDMDRVATGEHWYGSRALGLGLVDALQTTDDFLLAAIDDNDLYSVRWKGRKTLTEKVFAAVEGSTDAVLRRLGHAAAESRYGAG
jgi:serine protease SohB